MKLLFIGDIVARAGRELIKRGLHTVIKDQGIDVVVANGENAAGGAGITKVIAEELLSSGIDVLTSGNHIWDKREVFDYIATQPRLLRPANFPAGAPGSGALVYRTKDEMPLAVINVMGRLFMAPLDNPFTVVDQEVASARAAGARVILVDFHAEATSEKMAMGWHLDGRVTAVIGTHTHVQTADERVSPGGTAYLTDVGMTGAHDGIIGMERVGVVRRFATNLPSKIDSASEDARLHAVVITADAESGRATAIERLSLRAADFA